MMPNWISVTESLPPNPNIDKHEFDRVLVWMENPFYEHNVHFASYNPVLNKWRVEGSNNEQPVTHWMYPPTSPNEPVAVKVKPISSPAWINDATHTKKF